jgi:hypothetical protein
MSIAPSCFVPCDWCKNRVPLQYAYDARYMSAEDSTRRNCHQEGEGMMEPNAHLVCADRYLGTNVVSCCMAPPTITLNSLSDRASASIGKTRIGSRKGASLRETKKLTPPRPLSSTCSATGFAIINLPIPASPMSYYTGGVAPPVLSNQDTISANIEMQVLSRHDNGVPSGPES